MADELTVRFRRWFEYEQDAHARGLASLDTIPVDRRTGPEYRKAVSLFAHIVFARRVWLARLTGGPPPTGAMFPENPNLADVVDHWEAARSAWAGYLAGVTDADLARVFEYQALDGSRFRNRVEDVLAQTFGHSWYHRGQIAVLVKAAGGTPAVTDLVYWCREPVAG